MAAEQMELGEQRRDAGMALALEHAGEVWRQRARAVLETYAASGRPFSAETVRTLAGDPPSQNALGGLFGQAAKEGLIREYGRVKPTRASRHASKITLWVGVE